MPSERGRKRASAPTTLAQARRLLRGVERENSGARVAPLALLVQAVNDVGRELSALRGELAELRERVERIEGAGAPARPEGGA